MKWFRHDSDAQTDAKLKRVKHKYKLIGTGLYWHCIELIAQKVSKTNITFALEDDAELIALELGYEEQQIQEILDYFVKIDLFELNSQGQITCLKLATRLDDTNAKNPQIKELIAMLQERRASGVAPKSSEQLGDDQTNSDNDEEETKDSELQEDNQQSSDDVDISPNESEKVEIDPSESEKVAVSPSESEKVGESPKDSGQIRLDKIRLDYLNNLFVRFWGAGLAKQKKQNAEKAFIKLINAKSNPEKFTTLLVNDIKKRVEIGQLGITNMHPTTYLNQARWEDEIRPPDLAGPQTASIFDIEGKTYAGGDL